MPDPILTNANPGGLSFTIATFSNSGLDTTITIKLLYSMNTAAFYQTPTSGRSLSQTELQTLRGYGWTQVELDLYGDYGSTFVGITQAHLTTLANQGRTTKLSYSNLYNWLCVAWPSLRSYFIQSSANSTPYTISLLCPNSAPPALNVTYPSDISLNIPASIPLLQVYTPFQVPFSNLADTDPAGTYATQAKATINYPTPGTIITLGSPLMLIADPGLQATTTHKFTWYFPGAPALTGLQVNTAFTATASSYVPITLMVTNMSTGVSDAEVTYVIVNPVQGLSQYRYRT